MAAHDPTALLQKLKRWMPERFILALAIRHGFLQRERKLDIVFFVWTLILGWSSGSTRSLASLARSYQRHTGSDLERTSFYRRFDASLASMMRTLFEVGVAKAPRTPLGPFEKILALDATIVRLWDGLLDSFESTQAGQAALKLQLVVSVADMSANQLKIHSGREHELHRWKSIGSWVKGKLLLMDLGYYSFWLFHRIHKDKGFFLSRLKSNCTLLVKEDLGRGPGRRSKVCGKPLSQVLSGLKREHVEFLVEVPLVLRNSRKISYLWRVIGERNKETGKYHLYLTNAPEALIECEDARGLYGLRWQVELVFKGLKSVGRLHHLPSNKKCIIEALIYAALLFLLLSGWLRNQLFGAQKLWKAGLLRMMLVVREHADSTLAALAQERDSFQPRCLLDILEGQCRDPNGARLRAFAIPPIVEHSCGRRP